MNDALPPEDESRQPLLPKRFLILGWFAVAVLFASGWYAYDETRSTADPYVHYLGWSCLLWALAPLVLWFAGRHPIQRDNWPWTTALHLVVSVALSVLEVLAEATAAWMRGAHGFSLRADVMHYFTQHLQLYLLTYWTLLAAAQFYRMHQTSHRRALRAAQLESQLSLAKLESLRAQLQPHFLFNTLNAAVELVHQDADAAEDVLVRLSSLLRAALSELRSDELPLRKEAALLANYVGIQKRRFGERLSVAVRFDDAVLDCAVPCLILQPLVENAIRHGIGAHRQSDLVAISAVQEGDRLVLEVRNDSSALAGPPEDLLTGGVGLANTRARLQHLYGTRQSLHLMPLEPRGVCVRLTLPVHAVPAGSRV